MHAFFAFRRPVAGLPALALLLTLLQRTPAIRLVASLQPAVVSAPTGVVLRSAAFAASLGAVHSLAGATALISSSGSPFNATVGRAITPIAFTVSDTINLGSWRLGGNLPPGLKLVSTNGADELTGPGVLDATTTGVMDPYGDVQPGNTMTLPLLTGTPTTAGNYTFTLQAFQLGAMQGFQTQVFSFTVNVAASTTPGSAPSFTTQPAAQTVTAGATVTLTAAASGDPAPSFQWRRNGVAISGATSAALTLTNVQPADAGTYTVVATNASGSVTSTAAALVVNSGGGNLAPAMARQPVAQTVATGSTVVFVAEATGSPAPTYQWRRNGTPISGATNAMLVLKANAAETGTYSVVATNANGSVTSTNAALAVSSDANFGHLINLSILTAVPAAGDAGAFTIGYVVGGAGTLGPKPLVIRAAGPSLGALGVPGTLADPKIELFAGATKTGENDNWGGSAQLAASLAAVGAFPYTGPTSLDAAAVANITARDNSVKVSGSGTGTVIAEIYDATTSGTFGATTPRLVNVSVSKQIDAGGTLTAGFVIGGNTARTVLVRAIGPALAAFGVGGTIADPQLALYAGNTKIAENDNWGGDAQLTAAGGSVGAFAIANASSKDAVLLMTLAPGSYSAQVAGVAGTAGGSTLVEIYEVP